MKYRLTRFYYYPLKRGGYSLRTASGFYCGRFIDISSMEMFCTGWTGQSDGFDLRPKGRKP